MALGTRMILGPLLFLIYINDLPNSEFVSDGRVFTDDTNLTFADIHAPRQVNLCSK